MLPMKQAVMKGKERKTGKLDLLLKLPLLFVGVECVWLSKCHRYSFFYKHLISSLSEKSVFIYNKFLKYLSCKNIYPHFIVTVTTQKYLIKNENVK